MAVSLCFFLGLCVALATTLDLGPAMRIAQCRAVCLRTHDVIDKCEHKPECLMCWETCSLLERNWDDWGAMCQDGEDVCFPGCKTACAYHATRIVEEFLPSALPAPLRGPASVMSQEVAISFQKDDEQWHEVQQSAGPATLEVNSTTWIMVVAEDGVKQYSGEFWRPKLEALKEGPLFEASLTWTGADSQENVAEDVYMDSEIVKLNSKLALDFENDEVLENALKSASELKRIPEQLPKDSSAEKVEAEKWSGNSNGKVQSAEDPVSSSENKGDTLYKILRGLPYSYDPHSSLRDIPDGALDVFTHWDEVTYLERRSKQAARLLEGRSEVYEEEPSLMETTSKNAIARSPKVEGENVGERLLSRNVREVEDRTETTSYIVSWEPETGGLMGNQVTDTRSAQISLLPGVRYLVRIASNEGPGSFALEVDTTTRSVEDALLADVSVRFQPWAILAGCISAVLFMVIAVLIKVYSRTKAESKLEYV